jgi:flagellar biosynthesis activator protein FlaF
MHKAHRAYAAVAKETAGPRELEASLLLKAASKLQSVYDGWNENPNGLDDAILYNRRLWTVFLDSVFELGIFVMAETFSLMTRPKPDHLVPLISINRELAAGLRGSA